MWLINTRVTFAIDIEFVSTTKSWRLIVSFTKKVIEPVFIMLALILTQIHNILILRQNKLFDEKPSTGRVCCHETALVDITISS